MDFLRIAFNSLRDIILPGTAIDAEQDRVTASFDHCSRRNVYRSALLLSQLLPPELVITILDYAEFWHVVAIGNSPRGDRVGELQSPKLQASLTIPSHITRGSLRRIIFLTRSRDQGWSSYPADHGSYNGSWTWFEAGVRGLDPDFEDPSIDEPVNCEHANALDHSHRTVCLQNNERYKYEPINIITNVHAGRDVKEHKVEWSMDSPDESVRNMMAEIKGGCRIEVAAHARYPGWCNYVEKVQIIALRPVVRRM